jgi:dolichyl-phosphate beta-glucosyltransferase
MNVADSQCVISIVVPAYNELGRLPAYLDRIRVHCQTSFDSAYEVIVVDDGSSDGLGEYLQQASEGWNELVVARHGINQGKGAAVRTGVLNARGALILFADADGATPVGEEQKLRHAIERGADIAVGSRVGGDQEAAVQRGWARAAQSWAFRQFVHRSLPMPIADTQCGFKMFRREVGKQLFAACDEDGFLFDLFVLRLAMMLGYRVEEVPVAWHDVAGSRLRPIRDPLAMWRGLRQLEARVGQAMQAMESDGTAGRH